MSRFFTNYDIAAVSSYLSEPRLRTFVDIVKSKNVDCAIELHQATMSLGISIMAVAGLIEISLRNAACFELDTEFGGAGWLRHPPTTLKWSSFEEKAIKQAEVHAQRAAYSKMTAQEKAALDKIAYPQGVPPGIRHKKLAESRQRSLSVSDGQIIAQLTLHFWKRLFSEHYEKTLWKRALKRVFPNKSISRADIAEKIEIIYQIRNRLAHHEPVYGGRLEDSLSAIDYISRNMGNKLSDYEGAFYKLILPQMDILNGQVAIFKSTFQRLT